MIFAIKGQRRTRFVQPRIGHWLRGLGFAIGAKSTEPDIVISFVVSIPRNGHLTVFRGGNRRRPTAALLRTDADLIRPTGGNLTAGEHSENPVAHSLPSHPGISLGIRRRDRTDIVCLVLGKINRFGEFAIKVGACPDFEVRNRLHLLPCLILTPENPDTSRAILRHGRLINITTLFGDGKRDALALAADAQPKAIASRQLGEVT